MKIMIADDSALFRERFIVSISGMHEISSVIQASDSNEAINLFEKEHPGLIILDISMLPKSGIDVLEWIKNLSPQTIVMMLTNYSSEQFRKKCADLHADYFFDKSDEYDDMLNALITVTSMQ